MDMSTLNAEYGRLPQLSAAPGAKRGTAKTRNKNKHRKSIRQLRKDAIKLREQEAHFDGLEEEQDQDQDQDQDQVMESPSAHDAEDERVGGDKRRRDGQDDDKDNLLDEEDEEDEDEDEDEDEEKEARSVPLPAVAQPQKTTSFKVNKLMLSAFTTVCLMAGLQSFLNTPVGGAKTKVFVESLLKKVFELLSFARVSLYGSAFFLDADNDTEFGRQVWQTAHAISTDHLEKVSEHLDQLGEKTGIKHNTKMANVAKYRVFFNWNCFWSPIGKLSYPVSERDVLKLEKTLHALQNYHRREGMKSKRANTQSIDERVAALTWPENGFATLREALIPDMDILLAMGKPTDEPSSFFFDERDYRRFVQVLISAFYAFAPTGRVGGLKSLIYEKGLELVKNRKCCLK